YNGGRSEEWMGQALQGRRDEIFLMTKVCTHGRDRKTAMRQLEESLKRLRTDHLDLWQVHEVIYENDPDLHFAKGGVIEALDQAKKEGKVRFVGFTGHKSPAIHLKMLAHDYPFDTVQMPLNCFDATYRSFEQLVLPELARRGIAALGMQSLGGDGQPILHGAVLAEGGLGYARLGKTELEVSAIAFGTWAFGGDWGSFDAHESGAAIHHALDLGVTFFDTAQAYGFGVSERLLADALWERARRDEVIVATKGGLRMEGQTLLREASARSLREGER